MWWTCHKNQLLQCNEHFRGGSIRMRPLSTISSIFSSLSLCCFLTFSLYVAILPMWINNSRAIIFNFQTLHLNRIDWCSFNVLLTYASIESFVFFDSPWVMSHLAFDKKKTYGSISWNGVQFCETGTFSFIFDLFAFSQVLRRFFLFCFVVVPFFILSTTEWTGGIQEYAFLSLSLFLLFSFIVTIRNVAVKWHRNKYSDGPVEYKERTNWLKMVQHYRDNCLIEPLIHLQLLLHALSSLVTVVKSIMHWVSHGSYFFYSNRFERNCVTDVIYHQNWFHSKRNFKAISQNWWQYHAFQFTRQHIFIMNSINCDLELCNYSFFLRLLSWCSFCFWFLLFCRDRIFFPFSFIFPIKTVELQ